MSVASFELIATKRVSTGKSASRRLRQEQDQVPAILYGGKEDNLAINLDHNKLLRVTVYDKFYSQILILNIEGKKQKAILKDLQRHPFKPKILHLDFQRVKETDVITMHVPLHFIGTEKCPGVKLGGIVSHHANDVEVRCQAQFLPEFIEVDLSNLELGQVIHLSDLKLPHSVEIPALHRATDKGQSVPIVSVHIVKEEVITDTTATPESAAATPDSSKDGAAKEAKDNKEASKAKSTDKKDKK